MTDASFWDSKAEGYAKSPIGDMEAYNKTLERTQSYFSENDSVLELGCGTGTTALNHADKVREYLGTDLSGAMIDIANRKTNKQEHSNLTFMQASIPELARQQKQYDVVIALNLLHLLPDLENDLIHIRSLVKPGGLFISKTICQPVSGLPLKYGLMMCVLPIMQLFGMAPFVKIRKIGEFQNMITKQGFEIMETGDYPKSPPSRFIVARSN